MQTQRHRVRLAALADMPMGAPPHAQRVLQALLTMTQTHPLLASYVIQGRIVLVAQRYAKSVMLVRWMMTAMRALRVYSVLRASTPTYFHRLAVLHAFLVSIVCSPDYLRALLVPQARMHPCRA